MAHVTFFGLLSFFLSVRADYRSNDHRNVSELLDNLLSGYDNSIRPDFGGPPTVVEIDIMVRSMGPISEMDMDYVLDCYFRQSWLDERLSYNSNEKGTLALSISMLEKIWKPDTYFYNGKQSYLHTITTPNKFVRLSKDGTVLYSSRLTVKASCRMNLEAFPMDTQRCPLKLGSFGYTTSDVVYRWNINRTVNIANDMKMSQFDLIKTPSGNATEDMKSGERSILEASFYLRRHTGYFLLQVYFPCILLVVVSWVGFWINRENTSDRVTLGVTTVLTMTFLGLEARTDLPKVPYPTALDFFVFLSFAYIFASILQFAIVHYYTKYGSGEVYFNDSDDEDELEEGDISIEGRDLSDAPMSIIGMPRLNNGGMGQRRGSGISAPDIRELNRSGSEGWDNCSKDKRFRPSFDLDSINSVSNVDRFARVFFPVSFLAINVFYWYSYLNHSSSKIN